MGRLDHIPPNGKNMSKHWQDKQKGHSPGYYVFWTLAALVMYAWITSPPAPPTPEEAAAQAAEMQERYKAQQQAKLHGTRDDAIDFVKFYVQGRLKSPSTAIFQPVRQWSHTRYLGGNEYSFRGYVDSENSFGASIRTYFEGVVRWTGTYYKMVEITYV